MDRKKILLAFSVSDDAEVLRKTLAAAGYEVLVVNDGAAALQACREFRPVVVVSELQLQKIDGHHLLRELKSQTVTEKIAFVLVAGHRSVAERVHSINLGLAEYLTSPFHPEEVLLRLEMILKESEHSGSNIRRLNKGFSGLLDDMMLADLLQALQIGKKSAFIKIRNERCDGSIMLKEGELLTASLSDLTAEEALFRMFTWQEGNFRVDLREVDQTKDFDVSGTELIQLGSKHRAVWENIAAKLPPMQTKIIPGTREVAALPAPQQTILQGINGQTTLIDLIEEVDLPDLEALRITFDLFQQGLLVKAPEKMDRQGADNRRRNRLSRHQQYIDTIQSFLNTNAGLSKERKVERRRKDRRSGSERRMKSRRLSDYIGEDYMTHLNRTELLMIREKLANGSSTDLKHFLKDIQIENANR